MIVDQTTHHNAKVKCVHGANDKNLYLFFYTDYPKKTLEVRSFLQLLSILLETKTMVFVYLSLTESTPVFHHDSSTRLSIICSSQLSAIAIHGRYILI